jgi:hypothetical protein
MTSPEIENLLFLASKGGEQSPVLFLCPKIAPSQFLK